MGTDLSKMFDDMFRNGIGVDRLLDAHKLTADTMAKTNGFPPYNVRKTGENTYLIELAVAGFSIGDLEITLEKNVLRIKSGGHNVDSELNQFIHRGFAYRGFERAFTLMDNIEVQNAELINGILKVYLEKLIPESHKPKKINISSPTPKSHPQLLNEESNF